MIFKRDRSVWSILPLALLSPCHTIADSSINDKGTTILCGALDAPCHTIAASFVDDKGTNFDFVGKPTILCGAMDAVAFQHFGMEGAQIKGTFGERSSSGSNYGGVYYDGNLADHGDHAKSPHDPSYFPADPDEAERAFLSAIKDYSPTCSSSNYYCSEIDIAALNSDGWPDFVVFGSFYSSLLSEDFRGNATEQGVPIIELTNAYGGSEDTLPTGMVETTQRFEELSIALGVEGVEETSKGDKINPCLAASKFAQAAKISQDAGVRVMAGYLPYTGTGENGEIGAFLNAPERDTVLAMLEELGMPLLHTDAEVSEAYEYAVTPDFTMGKLPFENIKSSGALGEPVDYYVDFWLYDDRVTLDFLSDSFATAWPHVAVVAKQYAYFPSNARITSYRHAAEILNVIAEPLKAATKSNEASTTCTPVEGGTSSKAHRTEGLPPGQFACYDQVTYSFCADTTTSGSSSNTSYQALSFASFLLSLSITVLF